MSNITNDNERYAEQLRWLQSRSAWKPLSFWEEIDVAFFICRKDRPLLFWAFVVLVWCQIILLVMIGPAEAYPMLWPIMIDFLFEVSP